MTTDKESRTDFRVTFASMDRCALMTPEEIAELLGKTRSAIYHMLRRDEDSFPQPVMRQNRCIRWRAGDVRDWLSGMASAKPRELNIVQRRGRPRKSAQNG